MRRRREEERRRDPNRDPTQMPPERRDPNFPGSTPSPTNRPGDNEDESIKAMLDLAYFTADSYLRGLAEKSGGRLLRADTLKSLPDAFAQIAAELRTQYMLRKIKVTTTRKHVVIRARPGYLATNAK
jgi:hypothetical protein